MHTVYFPETQSVGQLMRVVRDHDQERWEDICTAQGTVNISAGERLILMLDNTTDLSPLDDVGPDALFGLHLWKLFTLPDDELRHVGRLSGLRYLSLGDAWEVTDSGMAHLAGLVRLEELDLTQTTITDKGLAYLDGLANVRKLSLWGTQVGDAGLLHVLHMRGLEILNLRYTKVSDEGVGDLVRLRNLKRLDLTGTNITVRRIEQVRRALPNCTITTVNG